MWVWADIRGELEEDIVSTFMIYIGYCLLFVVYKGKERKGMLTMKETRRLSVAVFSDGFWFHLSSLVVVDGVGAKYKEDRQESKQKIFFVAPCRGVSRTDGRTARKIESVPSRTKSLI
jgi:hypothetical protein